MTPVGLTLEQVAALVSMVVAAVSFFSWLVERFNRIQDRSERLRQIWNNLSKVRGLMSDLEKTPDANGFDHGKHQAVGKLTFMFRDLVNEAMSLESNPSLETIQKWRKVGKIGSDWQESCFINCLLTGELTSIDVAKDKLSTSDELPKEHAMSAAAKATGVDPK